jgi:hypothetical protein
MDAEPVTHGLLVIRRGRRFGWWIEGRKSNGRRYMFTWWPTKGLASLIARMWAAVLRRLGRGVVPIEVDNTTPEAT